MKISSEVSVVICCYNSAARIEETLRHLAFQKTPAGFAWEIIVVDNRSTDETARKARAYWDEFGLTGIALRIVEELTPGHSKAREAGLKNSNSDYVLFCDDDNWLSSSYVSTAFSLMQRYPNAGIIGGWCDGVYEIPLRDAYKSMTGALAIGKHGLVTGPTEYVNGAGMIVLKTLFESFLVNGRGQLLNGRTGKGLASGDDGEICWLTKYGGYDVRFDESLYFRHYMPKERLVGSYFLRLCLLVVTPTIVLKAYKYIYDREAASPKGFVLLTIREQIKNCFYFLPRIFLGRHKFYSLICFTQSAKIITLLFWKFSFIKEKFAVISGLKRSVAK